MIYTDIYIYTQFDRTKGCGGAGFPPPPPIIERLKLPQQTIYRRNKNLSESLNQFKYRKNILISRFYEQFLRSSRNLSHFGSSKKISNSLEQKRIIYDFEAGDLEMPNI